MLMTVVGVWKGKILYTETERLQMVEKGLSDFGIYHLTKDKEGKYRVRRGLFPSNFNVLKANSILKIKELIAKNIKINP